jgi:hypothetical protein
MANPKAIAFSELDEGEVFIDHFTCQDAYNPGLYIKIEGPEYYNEEGEQVQIPYNAYCITDKQWVSIKDAKEVIPVNRLTFDIFK